MSRRAFRRNHPSGGGAISSGAVPTVAEATQESDDVFEFDLFVEDMRVALVPNGMHDFTCLLVGTVFESSVMGSFGCFVCRGV